MEKFPFASAGNMLSKFKAIPGGILESLKQTLDDENGCACLPNMDVGWDRKFSHSFCSLSLSLHSMLKSNKLCEAQNKTVFALRSNCFSPYPVKMLVFKTFFWRRPKHGFFVGTTQRAHMQMSLLGYVQYRYSCAYGAPRFAQFSSFFYLSKHKVP